MKIGITPLITENIAPPNAKKLAIFNGNTKVCDVDISKIQPTNLGTKLYSFGQLSDVHMMANSNNGTATDDGNGYGRLPNGTKFHRALTFFENQGCLFVAIAGDLTNIGFWQSSTATTMYLNQFAEYKNIRELHPNLPVYGICGNHESYYKNITENLTELETYAGYGLNYTITQGNDLFIFIGQPSPSVPMTDETLSWLETTLEENKNKRCFVYVHSVVDDNDSGTRFGYYHNMTFDWWGAKKTTFINIMKKYKNAILFHGHTHMRFEAQTVVKDIIYSTALGFKSIHIPSIYNVRIPNLVDEKLDEEDGAQGYVVDVYENHIVLKGYNLLTNEPVPIGQYCIDTTLQAIA